MRIDWMDRAALYVVAVALLYYVVVWLVQLVQSII